jgi:hypothetical protein
MAHFWQASQIAGRLVVRAVAGHVLLARDGAAPRRSITMEHACSLGERPSSGSPPRSVGQAGVRKLLEQRCSGTICETGAWMLSCCCRPQAGNGPLQGTCRQVGQGSEGQKPRPEAAATSVALIEAPRRGLKAYSARARATRRSVALIEAPRRGLKGRARAPGARPVHSLHSLKPRGGD